MTVADLCIDLNELGYAVIWLSSSGENVVGSLKEMQPDMILMNVKLNSNKDGIDLARTINAAYDIPIVYMTGNCDESTWRRATETEHCGILLKPFNKSELHGIIERTLRRFEKSNKTTPTREE